jgi:hypothetical protein
MRLEAFLQQRVVEELAADGIILSRLGVSLQIEAVGDKLVLSLIDQTTGRASASTKLDQVPPDREAAVASVTQIVANLTAQLNAPRPPSLSPSPPITAADLDARDRAQLAFQKQAIGFGDEYEISVSNSSASVTRPWVANSASGTRRWVANSASVTRRVTRRWVAHRGELHEQLAPTDFYGTVGRPDLADAYTQRRNIKIGAIVVTCVLSGVSMGLLYKYSIVARRRCFDDVMGTDACADQEAEADSYLTGALIVLAGASVGAFVSTHYHYQPHPISEGEAKRLGAQYNRALRIKLGLPVAAGPARARLELGVTPYVAPSGGGLALVGRF